MAFEFSYAITEQEKQESFQQKNLRNAIDSSHVWTFIYTVIAVEERIVCVRVNQKVLCVNIKVSDESTKWSR